MRLFPPQPPNNLPPPSRASPQVTSLPYAEIAGAIASLNAHGALCWEG